MKRQPTIEYRYERNTRMATYKGRYNCEILIDGHFAFDGQGDTQAEAKRNADVKLRQWQTRNA